MKNFFFKKALPNSASFDTSTTTNNNPTSSQQQCHHQLHQTNSNNLHQTNSNNSIDKPQKCAKIVQRPRTLAPIVDGSDDLMLAAATQPSSAVVDLQTAPQQCHQWPQTTSFDHHHNQVLAPLHHLSSPLSCSSSTQGIIGGGCAVGNELFEQQNQQPGWHFMPAHDFAQSPTTATAQHFAQQTLHNCRHPFLVSSHPPVPTTANNCSNAQQQMSELMCTLVQQMSSKDAEIERLRMVLRRGKESAALERQRHADEENAAREQISRMRRKLRNYETELEYAKQQNRQATAATTSKTEQTIVEALDHAKLKSELAQEQRAVAEREAVWQRERAELNQTVQSLNTTLEELEQELRQREVHGREMQLQLERTVVERDMVLAELRKGEEQEREDQSQIQCQHQQQHQRQNAKPCPPRSCLSSPNGDDSNGTDEYSGATAARTGAGGGPSLASSSGIDSSSVLTDAKEIDAKQLRSARRKLIECRQKVARLISSAEKTQRGERLGREDLFGSFLSVEADQELPNTATQAQLLDDQVAQIGALRNELELLHDKFVILYARGTFEK